MSSFIERTGDLTIKDAIKMNKDLEEAAKWYCEHEITAMEYKENA